VHATGRTRKASDAAPKACSRTRGDLDLAGGGQRRRIPQTKRLAYIYGDPDAMISAGLT